jgi:hypothetical protein
MLSFVRSLGSSRSGFPSRGRRARLGSLPAGGLSGSRSGEGHAHRTGDDAAVVIVRDDQSRWETDAPQAAAPPEPGPPTGVRPV